MSQNLNQAIQNPFQTLNQLIQGNHPSSLFSFVIQLAQKYKLYISASFEVVYPEVQTDPKTGQQIIIIHAFLPDYIITLSVNQQNKVSFTVTPAVSVNCGGKQ